MKKILSFFVAALCCANISAQKLNESFEGEFAPEGWTTIDSHSLSRWQQGTSGGYSGSACAIVTPMEGASNYLITPALRPQAGDKLRFFARILDDYAKGSSLRLEISRTGTAAEDFTEVIADLPTSSQVEGMRLFKEWKGYELDFTDEAGELIYIAFHYVGNGARVALDDVSGLTLAGSATCQAPFNLTSSELTSSGVKITWEGTAAEYQYTLAPAGTAADWTYAQKTTEKSVTLTGLSEETAYNFYVRAYCSAEEQSLAPYLSFTTPCTPYELPWVENFNGAKTSSGWNVIAPECWIVSSETPQVAVVISKTYDDESEEGTPVAGTEHLYISGGGTHSAQVFALPMFEAPLNTLELAFDYYHNYAGSTYGELELGYMTNPSDSRTFNTLTTLPHATSDTHIVYTMDEMPAGVQFIAFRYAGGTSDLGAVHMDNFVVAPIGKSPIENVDATAKVRKFIENGVLVIEHNGVRYNAQGTAIH